MLPLLKLMLAIFVSYNLPTLTLHIITAFSFITGIPSSTLYKIARREGIRLAAPFNAAPTAWTQDDLERALEAIRTGQTTVQKAATEYGIPTGTLYGRCKREKIELSRSNPTPWSQDAMSEALDAIR